MTTLYRRDPKTLAKVIWWELWSLVEGDPVLRKWHDDVAHREYIALASYLINSTNTPEELEKKVEEFLRDVLPRYVGLVKKAMEVEKLCSREAPEFLYRVLEIFKSLAPLSEELKKISVYRTGLDVFPVYVGDWVKVSVKGELHDIEQLVRHPLRVLRFITASAEKIAKYIDDEEKRETFLKLVELAKQLNLGEWESPDGVRIDRDDPRYVYIGDTCLDVLDLEDLPEIIPFLDTLERLYDSILSALKSEKSNERILEQMRKAALPYILDKILG